MGTPDQYNLSWKNFRDCTSNTFRDLLQQQEFADVTLVCDDDKQLHAHKVILSACSPFFKKILLKNPHQHPLIYLTGVSRKYLSCMVSFMYLGQTNVAQEDLTGFMAAASKYQIKGLSEDKEKESGVKRVREPTIEGKEPGSAGPGYLANKVVKIEEEFEDNQCLQYGETGETRVAVPEEEGGFEPQIETSYTEEPAMEEVATRGGEWRIMPTTDDANYESFRQYDDSFACDHCQFSTKNKSNLKAHRNAKHLGVKYPCDQCDYKASYSNHLRQHKRVKHEGVNFPCDQCLFQTSQKSKLKLHIREKHGHGLDKFNNSLDNSIISSAGIPEESIISTPSIQEEDNIIIASSPSIQYLTAQLNDLVSQAANPLGGEPA